MEGLGTEIERSVESERVRRGGRKKERETLRYTRTYRDRQMVSGFGQRTQNKERIKHR